MQTAVANGSCVSIDTESHVVLRRRNLKVFLDAFLHLNKRVCPSVGPLVRWSVRDELISEKLVIFEQNSIKNLSLCH